MDKEQEKLLIESTLAFNAAQKKNALSNARLYFVLLNDVEYHIRIEKIIGPKYKYWNKSNKLVNVPEGVTVMDRKTVYSFMEMEITDLHTGQVKMWDVHPNALTEMNKLFSTISGNCISVMTKTERKNGYKESVWNIFDMNHYYQINENK